MTRLLVLFVLVCIPSSIASAQSLVSGDNNPLYDAVGSEQRPVSRLSVEDGLSQGSVNDLLQDEDGFMWFATQYGLNKYDGYSFTVFENDPDDSLSLWNNNIHSVEEDHDGNLWLLTAGGGVTRFDKSENTFHQYNHVPDDSTSLTAQGVTETFVSRDGTVWVGTRNGLNRYDPVNDSFIQIISDPDDPTSLSFPTVFDFEEDEQGRLWMMTTDGTDGVEVYEANRVDIASNEVAGILDLQDPSGNKARNHFVWSWDGVRRPFLIDSEGDAWVGVSSAEELTSMSPTEPAYVKRIDAETDALTTFPIVRTNGKTGGMTLPIVEDNIGGIWIAHEDGWYFYDSRTEELILFSRPATEYTWDRIIVRSEADSDGIIWSIVVWEDPTGRRQDLILLETFDTSTQAFSTLVPDPTDPKTPNVAISQILRSDETGIWFGSPGQGVDFYNATTKRFTHYESRSRDGRSLSSNTVTSLFEDRSGVVWMSHSGGRGLSKMRPNPPKFVHVEHDPLAVGSLGSAEVWAFLVDRNDDLWVGTSVGLDKYDPDTDSFQHFVYIPVRPGRTSTSNRVYVTYEDSEGSIWVGTDDGAAIFDQRTQSFTGVILDADNGNNFPSITDIIEDDDGSLWASSSAGVYYRPVGSDEFSVFEHNPEDSTSISSDEVRRLFKDSDGTMWIGTTNAGLNRYDADAQSFTNYRNERDNPASLSHDYILDVAELPDYPEILWVGTMQGFNRFDKSSGITKRYSRTNSDLPHNLIYAVESDANGDLWLSTNGGIARFNPETEVFTAYDTEDGLQSMEFNGGSSYRSKNGAMFFGGVNGFNVFYPDQLNEDLSPPDVALTKISIYNAHKDQTRLHNATRQDSSESLELVHEDNDLTFEFAALHYASPEKNLYKYRLIPYEATWSNPSDKREVRYTNLPPGSYTFRVQAANSDGVWNEEGLTFHIEIKPPWWKTIWAYIGYALLFAGAVFIVGRIQRRRIMLKQQEKARIEKAELEAVAASAETRALKAENAQKEAELEKTRELKYAFSALQDAHDGLKRTQDQLVQQEKLASLGQLTAGIAHEIKNPLNFVNNFAEVSEELAQELREAYVQNPDTKLADVIDVIGDLEQNAAVIGQHGKRADSIVRSMMQHASGGVGQREAIEINTLLNEHIDLAYHGKRAQHAGLNVDFIRDLTDGLEKIVIVPQEVGRVVLNLLGNALDAVHEYSKVAPDDYKPSVEISTRRKDDNLVIRISDNGLGVPVEIREKIFEPFFTTKPTGAGTGLGLSLSYDTITKGHGGKLEIVDTEEQGATFLITLPY